MKIKIESFARLYIILLLKEGPKYGYELMKDLENKLSRKISASQIYPFLSLLKENNLIAIGEVGNRDKKTYALTKKGIIFTNESLQKFGDLIQLSIKPELTVCTSCGCKVYEGGHKEKIRNISFVFCCSHCAAAYKKAMDE